MKKTRSKKSCDTVPLNIVSNQNQGGVGIVLTDRYGLVMWLSTLFLFFVSVNHLEFNQASKAPCIGKSITFLLVL